jgi:hypothetical protein
MFTEEKFISALCAWASKNGERVLPYFSEDLQSKILERMQLPTETSVEIAFRTLLAEGLKPTDGLTERQRANAARARQQQKIEEAVQAVQSVPLSKEELDAFSQMSHAEVRSQYASDLYFKTRYDEAVRLFGFQVR